MNECVLSTGGMIVIVEMQSTRIKSSSSANVSHKSRNKNWTRPPWWVTGNKAAWVMARSGDDMREREDIRFVWGGDP